MPSTASLKEFSRKAGIIVVLGPTATGKTETAIRIAEAINSEVISFDSIQVYREMDIGSAKPGAQDLARVCHHLISVKSPDEAFTAGDFRRESLGLIEKLNSEDKWAVLVGGTGFYLQALLKGMYPVSTTDPEIKKAVQKKLENLGREALFHKLGELDSEYQKNIHINDTYRLLRGFELWEQFGMKPSDIKKQFSSLDKFSGPVVQIGLDKDRSELEKIVLSRAEQMMAAGLLDEVEMLQKKYGPIRPLQSVGYKEALQVIGGQLPSSELAGAIVTATMQLAKRQKTWFKRDPEINWIHTIPGKQEIENLTKAVLN